MRLKLDVPEGQLISARGIASGTYHSRTKRPRKGSLCLLFMCFNHNVLSRPFWTHSSLYQSIPGRCPGLNLIWLSAINGFYSTFNPLRGWDTSELPNPRIPSAVNHIPTSGRSICRTVLKTAINLQISTSLNYYISCCCCSASAASLRNIMEWSG